MKTILELEQDIINITNKIQDKFPELTKYIVELPGNNSYNEEITSKNLSDYYHTLEDIISEYTKTHKSSGGEHTSYSDLQVYPASEDIYEKFKEETDIDTEDISKMKTRNEKLGVTNEKSFKEDMSGSDLDVPGSELDDQQESVGSEDEENNYYSIGGDNHNNLDEDKG